MTLEQFEKLTLEDQVWECGQPETLSGILNIDRKRGTIVTKRGKVLRYLQLEPHYCDE